VEYSELLWMFTQLPDDYLVLDTETTGLPDSSGLPNIITLGIALVEKRRVTGSKEFKLKPHKPISKEALSVHGISNEEASSFESLESQWNQISSILNGHLVVIHNASFDWPILRNQVAQKSLEMPEIQGVFCSQKAAFPWAQSMQLECSSRGPSLDTLTSALEVKDLRAIENGLHGARIDAVQTAQLVEAIRRKA